MTPDRASRVKSTAGNTPAIVQLTLARFREFYRESEVVFWSFAFPIMLSVGLGIAFRNRPAETLPVAVVTGPEAARLAGVLGQAPLLKASVMDAPSATRALALGRVALVVAPRADASVEYHLDPSRAESAIARARSCVWRSDSALPLSRSARSVRRRSPTSRSARLRALTSRTTSSTKRSAPPRASIVLDTTSTCSAAPERWQPTSSRGRPSSSRCR